MTEPATELREGQALGRYELVREIARGGMATVYLAQLAGAHGFEKWVAVKVIQPHLAEDPRLVTMFLDEVRVASRIRHTNVCSVLDLGVADDVPYLVMEYLSGVPLSQAMRRGWRRRNVPPQLVARVLADAARGLHAAHELRSDDGESLGVVHRDVSPQNIFVQHDGAVKVLDFGIARARGRLATTQVGELKGKVSYMAPEQLLLAPVDRRADVWSLGVLLWESTLGKRLFYVEDRAITATNVLRAPIPRPRQIDPSYPEDLERVVMGALARDPARRTPTAAAFADGLERWLYATGEPFGAAQVAEWVTHHFGSPRDPTATPTPSETALPSARVEEAGVGGRMTEPLAPMADEPGWEMTTKPSLARPTLGRRAMLVLAPVLLAALLGAVVGVISLTGSDDSTPASTTTTGPPTAAPSPEDDEPASVSRPRTAAIPAEEPEAPTPRTPRTPVTDTDTDTDTVTDTDTYAVTDTDTDAVTDTDTDAVTDTDTDTDTVTDTDTTTGTATEPRRPAPRRASRSEERPVAREETGSLNLLAIPTAVVRWRGRVIGRTPLLEHPLPAGRHTLSLRPVEGGREHSVAVEIRPREVTHRRVRLTDP